MVQASGPDHEVTSGGEVRSQCAVCLLTMATNFGAGRKIGRREMSDEGGFGRAPRSCLQQQQQGKRLEKAVVRAGTLVLIGQSLSGRVLQSRPRSSTSSSSSSAPFPLASSSSFSSSSSSRGKNGGECVVLSTPAPRPPPPNEKPLFCRHRGCEGRASSRPMGANFFSASTTPAPPTHPPTQPQEKVRLCRQAPPGAGWAMALKC